MAHGSDRDSPVRLFKLGVLRRYTDSAPLRKKRTVMIIMTISCF